MRLKTPPHISLKERWDMDPDVYYLFKQKQVIGGDTMVYILSVTEAGGKTHAQSYDAVLRKPIEIPRVKLDGVDSLRLDKQMAKIDWDKEECEYLWRNLVFPVNDKYADCHPVQKAISDVMRLERAGPQGRNVSERLQMKYWPDNTFEMLIKSVTHIQNKFESWKRLPLDGKAVATVTQAHELLCRDWAKKIVRREKRAVLDKPARESTLLGKKMADKPGLRQKR